MLLSDDQKQNLKKYCVSGYLMSNIHKKNYSLLQKLYEACTTDNKKLMQRFKEGRNVGLLPYNQIFVDIHYVIVDSIDDNPALLDLFLDYNKQLFPDVYDKAIQSLENGKKNIQISIQLNESTSKNERQWYYRYLFYDLGTIEYLYPEEMANAFISLDLRTYDKRYSASESQVLTSSISEYCFTDTSEPIFESNLFKKAVVKRRTELADYLGISEKKLNSYIHNTMKEYMELPQSKSSDIDIIKKSGITGTFQFLLSEIISNHNGGLDWMALMTNDVGVLYVDQKYVPDVPKLIEDYYRAVAVAKYNECEETGNPYTKLTLSRECRADTIKDDLAGIYAAYEIDVLTQMLMLLAERYYTNFSFEKLSKKKLQERYDSIIAEYTKKIDDMDHVIKHLTKEKDIFKLSQNKDIDKSILEMSRINEALSKELLDKEKEISQYKEKIRAYEDFIEQLKAPNIETSDELLDMDFLRTKRYLIVGALNEMYPQFRDAFPDSIYMQSETTNISGIKVDAILMVIPRMGHSMFYKIKSSKLYGTVPLIMSNNNKFSTICMDVQRALKTDQ